LSQHQVVGEGFAYAAIERLREVIGRSIEAVSAVVAVPKRTLARRRSEGRLDSHESDRGLRVARLLQAVLHLLEGDADRARVWFHAPQRAWGGRSPLALTSTDVSAREVEALVVRLEHGVVS